MTQEEVDAKWKEHCELNSAVKRRNFAAKQAKEAATLGIGDAVEVAIDIEQARKALSKELRVNPLKGKRNQTALERKLHRQAERDRKRYEREYNPKIKGLSNVPGLECDEDGTIRLQALREQRPDILAMRFEALPGQRTKRDFIAIARRNAGRPDRYGDANV